MDRPRGKKTSPCFVQRRLRAQHRMMPVGVQRQAATTETKKTLKSKIKGHPIYQMAGPLLVILFIAAIVEFVIGTVISSSSILSILPLLVLPLGILAVFLLLGVIAAVSRS